MKRMESRIALAFILAVCSLAGCGKAGSGEKKDTAASALTTAPVSSESALATVTTSADKTEAIQPAQTETALPDQTEAPQPDKTEVTSAGQSESAAVTEEQALEAIKNYCFTKNPDLKNMVDSGEYNIYWNAAVNDADQIVVLYRSYTAAQIRYYINPVSGETYVTELVPGLTDEEQRTEESFNVRDYLA